MVDEDKTRGHTSLFASNLYLYLALLLTLLTKAEHLANSLEYPHHLLDATPVSHENWLLDFDVTHISVCVGI